MDHLRVGDLNHLVSDYKSTRSFTIANNHELSPYYALRTINNARARSFPRPRPYPKAKSDEQDKDKNAASDDVKHFDTDELNEDAEDGADFVFPCVNKRTDENGEPIHTNKQLCNPNVLYWSSSGSEPSSVD